MRTTERPTNDSILSLLHPGGPPRRVGAWGDEPWSAALAGATVSERGPLDVLVVAPSERELRAAGSERRMEEALAAVADDGVVYLAARPRVRARVRRLLHNAGYADERPFLHLPTLGEARYLLPLGVRGARALVAFAPLSRLQRLRAAAAVVLPRPLHEWLVPNVGIAFRRPSRTSFAEWALPEKRGFVAAGRTGRLDDARFVLFAFSGGARFPDAVVKARLNTIDWAAREADTLRKLGASARAAGADVPTALRVAEVEGGALLVESPVRGPIASGAIARRPRVFDGTLRRVADWLESWNAATVIRRPLEPQELAELVLDPGRALAPDIEGGDDYIAWLASAVSSLEGRNVPLVAVHQDLTMFNVILGDERLGIVDWEEASSVGLPATDFIYAAADAAASARNYDDRVAAALECFTSGGRHSALVSDLRRRLDSALGVTPDFAELAFHSCWLRHAFNERVNGAFADPPPFLTILRRVARSRIAGDNATVLA